MNARTDYFEDEPDDNIELCEHGIPFDEDCEWCGYEEDGPLDLEDAFDRSIERAFERFKGK
jgi:hypothetical protein